MKTLIESLLQAHGLSNPPLVTVIMLASAAGCMATPDAPQTTDASVSPTELSVTMSVHDKTSGAQWTLSDDTQQLGDLSNNVEIVIESYDAITNSQSSVFLFREANLEQLRSDLARSPLRQASEAWLVEKNTTSADRSTALRPLHALDDGRYTVAIANWAENDKGTRLWKEPILRTFQITRAKEPSLQPRSIEADILWPTQIVAETQAIVLQITNLDETHPMTITEDANAIFKAVSCVEPANLKKCLWVKLSQKPAEHLTLEQAGQTLASFEVRSSPETHSPSKLLATPCAADEVGLMEQKFNWGCVWVSESSLVSRHRSTGPLMAYLNGQPLIWAKVGDVFESNFFGEDVANALASIDAIDEKGVLYHAEQKISLLKLPTLSITEVRADPIGAEPHQEYIEILNYGDFEIDLFNFEIADNLYGPGDRIRKHIRIKPHQRALVVGQKFMPTDASETNPDPQTLIIRLDESLGTNGLSNSGETVVIRDNQRRRLSQTPDSIKPKAGLCLQRKGSQPRWGRPSDFVNGPCSPNT